MARGNSKLYRIHVDNIKVLCNLNSTREIEKAFIDGYTFVRDEKCTKVYMISTTCSKKSLRAELINVDVVMDDNVKEIRI